MDEDERIQLVVEHHRGARVRLPNARLHAAIHVVVENQLAMGEVDVVDALKRLQREGLDRHDAIHAIGSILAEHMHRITTGEGPRTPEASNREYFEKVRRLTAEAWRRTGAE